MASTHTLLTPRDRDILLALARSPLTARQLLPLSATFAYPFTCERKVRARLQLLAESGRVRRWPYVAIAGRSAPTYYTLAREGYRLLFGAGAVPQVRRAFEPIAIARQLHTHALAAFIVHTFVAAHGAGIGVVQFGRENSVRLSVGQEHLYPDCTFTLEPPGGGAFRFCVEIDNRTERIRSEKDADSWERKIRLYEAAQDASAQRFRVLAVSMHATVRTDHILETALALARNPQRSLVYGITLADYLRAAMPLTSPCFTDHRGQAVALVTALPHQALVPAPVQQRLSTAVALC